jgi:hypothetical protein
LHLTAGDGYQYEWFYNNEKLLIDSGICNATQEGVYTVTYKNFCDKVKEVFQVKHYRKKLRLLSIILFPTL